MELAEDIVSGIVLVCCMAGAIALPVLVVLALFGVVSW